MDNIEKDFKEQLGIDLTIHMDPVEINNPVANKLYDLIMENFTKCPLFSKHRTKSPPFKILNKMLL